MRLGTVISVVTILVVLAGPVHAANTGWRKITVVDIKNDAVHLVVDGAPLTGVATVCSQGNRQVFRSTGVGAHSNYDSGVATILTAFAAGYDVDFYYNIDAAVECDTYVTRIRVKK